MREIVARLIVDHVGRLGNAQYIVITPSGFSVSEGVNVIVVQNIEGKSIVREVV
jgi:aromatic ring-opening dioxygenase LigB subunit